MKKAQKQQILTVTLNPAVDKFFPLADFRTGQEYRIEKMHVSAGGKGINVAKILQKFGVNSLAAGFLGGGSGAFIEKELQTERIATKFVWINDDTRTNFTIIDKNSRLTRILEEGPRITAEECGKFRKVFLGLVKRSSYIILSGRKARGLPDSIYRDIITEARRKNAKVILDTSGRPFFLGLQAKPFMIKPNLEEAQAVLQKKLRTLKDVKNAVKFFLKKGIPNVIISLGKNGLAASQGDIVWHASIKAKRVVNTVGCGDALIAGFVWAISQGHDFEKSIQYAVAAGTANALNMPAGCVTKRQVIALTKCVNLRKL